MQGFVSWEAKRLGGIHSMRIWGLKMLCVFIGVSLLASGCHYPRAVYRRHAKETRTTYSPGPMTLPEWAEHPSWYEQPESRGDSPGRAPWEPFAGMIGRLVTVHFFSDQAVRQFYEGMGGKAKLTDSGAMIVSSYRGTRILEWMDGNPNAVEVHSSGLRLRDGGSPAMHWGTVGADDTQVYFLRYDEEPTGTGLFRYAMYQNVRNRSGFNATPILRVFFEDEVTMRPGQWYLRMRESDALDYPVAVILQTWITTDEIESEHASR